MNKNHSRSTRSRTKITALTILLLTAITLGTALSSTSNTAAPAGSAWIEGSSLHWANGTTEYFFNPVPSNDSAVGTYHLDSGTGQTALDLSVNNNDGTLGNSTSSETSDPSWTSGKFDDALSFDGSDDYVALPQSYSSSNIGSFSVTAWVNVPTDGGGWSIVDFDRSEYFTATAGIPSSSAGGEGDYVGFHTTDSGGTISDMWSSSTIRDGSWHHVAWVFDGSTKYIYIDGSQDNTQSVSGVGTGTTRYGFLGDGSEASSFDGSRNNNYFQGDMDEVRIYNRALSQDEIQRLYEGAGSKTGGPTGAWWVEGSAMHWIDQNGYERAYTGSTVRKTVYSEGFDDGTANNWNIQTGDTDSGVTTSPVCSGDSPANCPTPIDSHILQVDSSDIHTSPAIDLSSYSSATLNFAVASESMDDSSEDTQVDVSSDGGSTWTTLKTVHNVPTSGSAPLSFSIDISSYTTSNFKLRIDNVGGNGGGDHGFLDEVKITVPSSPSAASPGNVWIENGVLHYIDANGNERRTSGTVFMEDFDSQADGDFPDGWTKDTPWDSSNPVFEVDTAHAVGSASLYTTEDSQGGSTYTVRAFKNLDSIYTPSEIHADIRLEGHRDPGSTNLGFNNVSYSDSSSVDISGSEGGLRIIISPGGDSSNDIQLTGMLSTYSINTGQWYDVSWRDIDWSSQTMDVYIEGVQQVNDASFSLSEIKSVYHVNDDKYLRIDEIVFR